MARYQCTICGFIFDEEKEGRSFDQLDCCPACKFPRDRFVRLEEGEESREQGDEEEEEVLDEYRLEAESEYEPEGGEDELTAGEAANLAYRADTARKDPSCRYMDEIHEMALKGRVLYASMATQLKVPAWDDILIMSAPLIREPLEESDKVSTTTVIGKNAAQPMVLDGPVYISHMSFGALSKEAKIALARGSAAARTAIGSGEGGILPEERRCAYKYIFEYVPNLYSVTDENLQSSDAIEIKLGQATKPGMGGHLPGDKVTEEIAQVRGRSVGEDIQSPASFADIRTGEDLRAKVDELRERSGGRPIGIKIAADHIEEDLEFCVSAGPDFITVDGRGGASASSPLFLRDSAGLPTIYALSRARRYLDSIGSQISLVITGGLRVSSDFAKALAMGADAVAVATGALMAAGCQQYRLCQSGKCPVGIATQDEKLRARFDTDAAAVRVTNYLNVSLEELKMFARVTGHRDVHDLELSDLGTTSRNIAEYTGIAHV